MPEPLRSPKQSRVAAKSRTHPYSRPPNGHRTRDVGVERSNSLLGALKSIVTAPLAWFSGDTQGLDDAHQKRRMSLTERGGTPPKAKRVRRNSPEAVEGIGYLDPPPSLFVPKRPSIPRWDVANGVPPARTMSLDAPLSSVEPAGLPLPTSRGASVMTRTSMSLEPQDALPTRKSTTRDVSMAPPSPFARSFARSSFTTLGTGATFGPSPKRKARESTAPPLLGSSTHSPSFTRPPPTSAGHQNLFPRPLPRGTSEGPMYPFLARSRQSISPVRESFTLGTSMLVGSEVPVSRSPSMAKAERTLSTLESFRTPLHSSLFPSTPPVENHRPRKVHVPLTSRLRFDHTPESKKDRAKRVPEVIGPYAAGMSGMRKLLARRREELEKEVEMEIEVKGHTQDSLGAPDAEPDEKATQKDQAIGMDTKDVSEFPQGRVHHVNGISPKDDMLPSGSPARLKGDSYSSLRAPSSKVHRSHASAPKLRKPRNKFSLDDDDDEQEWNMSIEELKNYQARTQTHISFSTSRRMSETGMQTDTSADDESRNRVVSPILPAQPQTFDSLLSRIGPSTDITHKPAAEFPAEPPKTESDVQAQIQLALSSESSSAPATLPFSLGVSIAPTSVPQPADIPSPFAAPSTTSGTQPVTAPPTPAPGDGAIPSFFANTKAQFMPPKVPAGSLFGTPTPNGETEMATEKPPNLFGAAPTSTKEEATEDQAPKEPKPPPFGGISKPSVFGGSPASPFGNVSFPSTASATLANNTSSPFGRFTSGQVDGSAEAPKPAFSFGAAGATGANASSSDISIFGAASKPVSSPFAPAPDTPTKAVFSFNAPPSGAPSVDKQETPSSDAPSGPAFSFGAPASSSVEIPKSLYTFGASTQPKASDTVAARSPFSFGAAPSTPPPAEKKTGFTFGVTSGTSAFSRESDTTTADATNVSTSEPLKSAFGGFGSVGITTPSTPKPSESTADNGDRMEVGGDRMEDSPTRSVEKKDTPAIQLPQSSPFTGFGDGTSTGFSFGQNKAAPTGSAFSLGQSKPPPVTTGFSFGQNTNTSTNTASTGFSFGTNATKHTGQTSSIFSAPLPNAFGGSASTPAASSPFSFAQPNTSSTANPFGSPQQQQPENSSTATPNSPSLFPQTTPQPQSSSPSFSFSLPAAAGTFGAPKPDPASVSSPSTQPFQFGASSSSQQPQPPGTPTAATMFTLGGAAATPPRKVKGLPTRRGKRP